MTALQAFARWLAHQGNRPKTVRGKLEQLRAYLAWLPVHGFRVDTITYGGVMAYIGALQERGRSKASINQHLRVAEQYHRSLGQPFPAAGVRLRGVVNPLPEVLQQAELEALYTHFNSPVTKGYYYHTDKLILGLVVYQALELRDLFLLEHTHLDLSSARLYVPGRHNREGRTLPLAAHQVLPWHDYLDKVRPRLAEAYSFNAKPAQASGKLLIPQGDHLERIAKQQKALTAKVRTQAKALGFTVKSLQQLRQSRLALWVKEHGLRKAQYLAGFRSIAGIERYKTQYLEDLQKQLDDYHPLR